MTWLKDATGFEFGDWAVLTHRAFGPLVVAVTGYDRDYESIQLLGHRVEVDDPNGPELVFSDGDLRHLQPGEAIVRRTGGWYVVEPTEAQTAAVNRVAPQVDPALLPRVCADCGSADCGCNEPERCENCDNELDFCNCESEDY